MTLIAQPGEHVPPPWQPRADPVPLAPGHMREDHFLRQFDRYQEGEPRLRAMAGHCAYIYNSKQTQVRELEDQLEAVVARLRAGDNVVAIALDLHEYLEERRR